MKKFLINIFLIFFFWATGLPYSESNAQCAWDNQQFGTSNAPALVGQTLSVAGIWGGEFRRVNNMIQGSVYRISVCGGATFDSQLSIYPEGGGNLLAWNDDYCGAQSQLDFIPPVTGNYDVLLDQYYCRPGLNYSISTIRITLISIGQAQPAHCGQVFNIPYLQDFETFPTCGSSCGSSCPLPNSSGWSNSTTDDQDWTVAIGSTPTLNTGPTADHTHGNPAGHYLYTESSGCNNNIANLVSPCFYFTGQCPVISFWYHMNGESMGTLSVDVSPDQGNSWNSKWTLSGNQNDEWKFAWIDLSQTIAQFGPVLRFRFRALTGYSFTSDLAIDDVKVFNYQNADPGFAGLPLRACISNSPVRLVAVTPGGIFSGPGVSGDHFYPALAGPGTHNITYSVGPLACRASSTTSVTVLPPPTLTAGPDVDLCYGESTTLTVSSPSCTNPAQSQFDITTPSQVLAVTGGILNFSLPGTPQATGDGTLHISYRGDIDLGTTEQYSLFIEGTPLGNTLNGPQCSNSYTHCSLPVPLSLINAAAANGSIDILADAANGINTICTSQDMFIQLIYPTGGCGYQWSTGQQTSSITVSPNRTSTYYVAVTDPDGCSATDSVTVNIIPKPVVDAGQNVEICEGASTLLIATGFAGGGAGNEAITTTWSSNNSGAGNMFDVVIYNPITLSSFSGNWSSSTADVEIWYRSGTHVGYTNNPTGWTSLGRSGIFSTGGTDTPSLVPLPLHLTLTPGTYSFYLHSHTGTIRYTSGALTGNIFSSDVNLSILEGTGKAGGAPFSPSNFPARVWNGTMVYGVGAVAPNVTFAWDHGSITDTTTVSPTLSTTYFVTATDADGCQNRDSVTVKVNPNPVLTFNIQDNPCFGDCLGEIDMEIAGSGPGISEPVDIGPHSSVFTSALTRGFWFVAPSAFSITSLRVPTDGGTDPQYVQVVRMSAVPPDFPTLSAGFNTLFYQANVPGTAPIPVNIPVNPGDMIGILGARSSDGITMLNSYNSAPNGHSTTILGNPVTLMRMITQQGLGTPAVRIAGTNTRSPIGRVEFTVGGGPAFSQVWSSNHISFPGSTQEDLSGLCSADYTVTVTDLRTGCTTEQTLTTSEPGQLLADAGTCRTVYPVSPDHGCTQLAGSASGGSPGYAWSWSDQNGNPVGDSANVVVCPCDTTDYYLRVTDQHGCTALDTVTVWAEDITCSGSKPTTALKVIMCHKPGTRSAHTHCIDLAEVGIKLSGSGAALWMLGPCQGPACTILPPPKDPLPITCNCEERVLSITLQYIGQNGATFYAFLEDKHTDTLGAWTNLQNGTILTLDTSMIPPAAGVSTFANSIFLEILGCGPWLDIELPAKCTDAPIAGQVFYPFRVLGLTDENGNICPDPSPNPCGPNKTLMCHYPLTPNAQTLCVDNADVQKNLNGPSSWSLGPCPVNKSNLTGQSGEKSDSFFEAFPNPFSLGTTLRFNMENDEAVLLKVFSLTGQEMATLFDGDANAGQDFEVIWNPERLSEGVYFARLTTGSGKILLLKLILAK